MDESRVQKRLELKEARKAIDRLPHNEWFELAGRPTVFYELVDYGKGDKAEGAKQARADVPYLFKAFETGQAPPPRPGSKNANQPRVATIHEYLDWTVTHDEAVEDDELDFGGFRVVLLFPRFKPGWPPPGTYQEEAERKHTVLGAPRNPLPQLLLGGRPICAATIRLGTGYMEVPFFATMESRRNKGYGRAMLEAIEQIARALNIPRLLLCSTDDPVTKATWKRLGFEFTSEEDMQSFGVDPADLLHMDNTVQMHRDLKPARQWKSVIFRHGDWRQRLYYPADVQLGGKRKAGDSGLLLLANGQSGDTEQPDHRTKSQTNAIIAAADGDPVAAFAPKVV
ncbi:hypothetical protein WJX72_009402 [[Myrmecia] bisecta]|uniref:N-acetyltransferase domain-containing protein n=1 Tax=[Myrmecia] bisecta TaxID=41462 RepID=A0AAW1P0T8_9CHLO